MNVIIQHRQWEHRRQILRQVGACGREMAGDLKVAWQARGSARGGAGHISMWGKIEGFMLLYLQHDSHRGPSNVHLAHWERRVSPD